MRADMWNDNNYFEERDRWSAQTAENSARSATAWGNVHSKGWGETLIEDAIMFGATFVNQPTVAYGFALDDSDQAVDTRLPRCSGGVYRWVQDANDFYVGAYVFVTVATADPMLAAQAWLDASLGNGVVTPPDGYDTDPDYDITHSFTFQALAIKDITS